jgi:hypothetical protein
MTGANTGRERGLLTIDHHGRSESLSASSSLSFSAM